MNPSPLTVRSITKITPDVLQITTNKPERFVFEPGQAAEISINNAAWKDEKRPFTFTSLPTDSHLEFCIKTYPSHNGVTNELLKLKKGDQIILHDVFGAITYKSEGTFIAGGAGVTPFISIFRHLKSKNIVGNNKLIFANKTKADIILEKEFTALLGKNFINILSDEKVPGYASGFITADFLKANSLGLNKMFYVCGPPPMMEAVGKQLTLLGVSSGAITVEI